MTIPIQAPQIRPDVIGGTPGSGLEPLIQALQFYKQSKLAEQRQQLDAQRTTSDVALQGAQTDTMRANLQRQTDEDEAWRKQISTAPAALQPFLKLVDASRGLPPELQHITASVAASQIPGMSPQGVKDFQGYLRLGLPLDISAKMSGVEVYDLADTKSPHSPTAIGLPKNMLRWTYTPPGSAERDLSRELRAQGMIVNQADRDDAVVARDLTKVKEQIAVDIWKQANPGAAQPLLPIHFDPNDPAQALALHRYVQQHHYDTRLQVNRQNRDAANQRINATARGASQVSPADAAASQLQQTIDLMSQVPDSTHH